MENWDIVRHRFRENDQKIIVCSKVVVTCTKIAEVRACYECFQLDLSEGKQKSEGACILDTPGTGRFTQMPECFSHVVEGVETIEYPGWQRVQLHVR